MKNIHDLMSRRLKDGPWQFDMNYDPFVVAGRGRLEMNGMLINAMAEYIRALLDVSWNGFKIDDIKAQGLSIKYHLDYQYNPSEIPSEFRGAEFFKYLSQTIARRIFHERGVWPGLMLCSGERLYDGKIQFRIYLLDFEEKQEQTI